MSSVTTMQDDFAFLSGRRSSKSFTLRRFFSKQNPRKVTAVVIPEKSRIQYASTKSASPPALESKSKLRRPRSRSPKARRSIEVAKPAMPEETHRDPWDVYIKNYCNGRININSPGPRPKDKPPGYWAPPPPPNNKERLRALYRLNALDKEHNVDGSFYVQLVKLARAVFDMQMVAIILLDEKRQWFKASIGAPSGKSHEELPMSIAFCAHSLHQPPGQNDAFTVTDMTKDWRFQEHPLVAGKPGMKFYSGAPLVSRDGHRLGTFCLMDIKARKTTKNEEQRLKEFAQLTATQLEKEHETEVLLLQSRMQAAINSYTDQLLADPAHVNSPDFRAMIERHSERLVPRLQRTTLQSRKSSLDSSSSAVSSTSTVSSPPPRSSAFPPSYVPSSPSMTSINMSVVEQTRGYFDQVVNLVSELLTLDLVYVLHVSTPSNVPAKEAKTMLVSSIGLSITAQSNFDAPMHLQALNTPQGLLYENPNPSKGNSINPTAMTFVSGIVVPIWSTTFSLTSRRGSNAETRGYVLGAFTRNPRRVFEGHDITFIQTLTSTLSGVIKNGGDVAGFLRRHAKDTGITPPSPRRGSDRSAQAQPQTRESVPLPSEDKTRLDEYLREMNEAKAQAAH